MDNPGRGGRGPYNTRGRGGRGSQYYNRNKQNSFRNNPDYRQRQSECEQSQSNEVQETTELIETPQRSYYARNNSDPQSQEHRGRGNRGGGRRIQGGRRRQSSSSDTRPYQETNRRKSESQTSPSSAKVANSKVDLKLITPSSEEEEKQMLKLAIEESKKTADKQKAFYDEISQVEVDSVLSDGEESSNFDAAEEARKMKSFNDFLPLSSSETNEVVLELLPETNGTQSGNLQSDAAQIAVTGVEQSGKDWTLYGAKPKGTVSVARVPVGRGMAVISDDSSSLPQFGSFLNSKGNISASVHRKTTEQHSEESIPMIKNVVSKSSVEENISEVLTDNVEVLRTKENATIESLTKQLKESNIDPVSDSKPDSISTIVTTYPVDVLETSLPEMQPNVTESSLRGDVSVVRPQSSPLLETPTDRSQFGLNSNAVNRLHQTEYSLEMVARGEQNMMAQNKSSGDDEQQRCVELELKSTDSMEQITSQNTQPTGISQIIVPYPAMYQYPGIVYQIGFPSPYFPHMKPAMFPYQNAPPTVISTLDGQLIPTAPIPQHLPVDYSGFIPRFVAPGQSMEPPAPPPPIENNVDQLQVDYQSLLVSQSMLSVNAEPFSPRETPRTHAPSFYSKPKGNRGGHYGPGHQRNYNTGYHNPRNGHGNYHRPPHRHPFPSRNYQDYGMNPLQHSEIQAQDVPNENPQFYGGANFYQCNPYQRQDFR